MSNAPTLSSAATSRDPVQARGLPLVGFMFEAQRDRLKMICNLRDRGDVVRFPLAGLTMYLVNQPAGIQRVLQDHHRNYPRGKIFAMFREMAGNGLVFSDGAFWLRQRRLMSPMFHHRHVSGYAGIMLAAAQDLTRHWHQKASTGELVDINQDFTNLTMAVVTRALFSADVSEASAVLGDAVTTLLEAMTFRFDVPIYPPMSVPTPRNLRLRQAIRTLDQTLYSLIQQRRSLPAEQRPPDLLTMLIEARDEDGEGMSDRQLRDEALTMFAAGHETTANALTWAYSLLATHPEQEERLFAEVDQAIDGQDAGEIDPATLPFTRRVFDETLRIYPPVWVTNRQAVEEDVVMGVHIPAGALMSLSPYGMHRHPAYWSKPEVFDPDRFLPERVAERPRYAYFPFGGGPHLCIGQGFATMEAVLVMSHLSRRFRLRLAPGFNPKMKPSVTLRPKAGMWMKVEERQ